MFRNRNRRPRRGRVRKLRLVALVLVLGLLGLTAFTFGLLRAVASQIPALVPRAQPQQQNTYVYANNGTTLLAILRGSEARIIVPSQEISPWMKHAIVAIEDKRFYQDRGIDLRGILRALWVDITTGSAVQGGSTITQQFIKNEYNGSAPSITRKLREAALAWELDQAWPKDKILTAYLNTIYFGNGAYGVQEAARIYFHENASQLEPGQAALLAAIPEDPSLYDPVANPAYAKRRRDLVLYQMYLQNYLTWKQYKRGLAAAMPDPETVRLAPTQSPGTWGDPYFANYVTDQLVAKYGTGGVYGGGLHVTTTLNPMLQRMAQHAIATVLPPSVGPSAALVTIDARTGQVLAMVGGRNYHQSQFNLATQGERQPGSAFKPFVLAAALKAGIAPSTTLVSGATTIYTGGKLWSVNNFEHESLGPINLSTAIAYSDNTVFAQLTNIVGPKNVVREAHAMGITTPLQPYFSIGLGAEPATPLEMARAYVSLADGGYRLDSAMFGNEPIVVKSLTNAGGATHADHAVPVQVPGLAPINGETTGKAALEVQMLQGVVNYGTGTAAQLPGWQVAGKTGTTENYGDAWFVGFTAPPADPTQPQLVTAVWVGYPNNLVPMLKLFHNGPVEGGTYPALIWKAYTQRALAYLRETPTGFPAANVPSSAPSTVTFGDDYGNTGVLALDNGYCKITASIEFFVGQAPSQTAHCLKDAVEVPNVHGWTLSAAESQLAGQPLQWHVATRPARPGARPGIVVGERIPPRDVASAYTTIDLVVSAPRHGVVPNLVGLSLDRARALLARKRMRVVTRGATSGRVVAQRPAPGVAAGPGLQAVLTLRPEKGG